MSSRKLITCPRCGFRFALSYARTVACRGCPLGVFGSECNYVRCPRCGYEFPLQESTRTARARRLL